MIVCKSSENVLSIEHLYNTADRNTPVPIKDDNLLIGLSNTDIKFENGVLTCSFKRLKAFAGEDKYFSVKETQYYILTAHGLTNGGKLFSTQVEIKFCLFECSYLSILMFPILFPIFSYHQLSQI